MVPFAFSSLMQGPFFLNSAKSRTSSPANSGGISLPVSSRPFDDKERLVIGILGEILQWALLELLKIMVLYSPVWDMRTTKLWAPGDFIQNQLQIERDGQQEVVPNARKCTEVAGKAYHS